MSEESKKKELLDWIEESEKKPEIVINFGHYNPDIHEDQKKISKINKAISKTEKMSDKLRLTKSLINAWEEKEEREKGIELFGPAWEKFGGKKLNFVWEYCGDSKRLEGFRGYYYIDEERSGMFVEILYNNHEKMKEIIADILGGGYKCETHFISPFFYNVYTLKD